MLPQPTTVPPVFPRFGSVPYANAWPLTFFWKDHFPDATIERHLPSQLPFRLTARQLDVALMPIATLVDLPHGVILGDVGICCRGPVDSVLLYSKCPIGSIRHVALDVSSRSSVLLTEVLFREFYGIAPEKDILPLDADFGVLSSDAFVLIGDPALRHVQAPPWEFRYDLGELWREHTGLPFVFAAWIACRDTFQFGQAASVAIGLQSARDRGLAELDRIVAHYAADPAGPFPDDPERLRAYLEHSVRFRIGPEERTAIEAYFDLAARHALIPRRVPVAFVGENG